MELDLLSNRLRLREQLTSGALCDALDTVGAWSVLPQSIRRVSGGRGNFFGQAYTVCWGPTRKQSDIRASNPSTWQQIREFIIPTNRPVDGMVYVSGAQNGSVDRFALAGGLSTLQFEQLGMEAVVLFGAVRDADEVALRKIPVFATGYSPLDSQGNYKVISAGEECMVGDICVKTGDWVFGDSTGIVVLPTHLAAEVISRALGILQREAEVQEKLKSGQALMDILDHSGHI